MTTETQRLIQQELDAANAALQELQQARKPANREAFGAATLIGLEFVACCLVGVFLGIGLAAIALSL